MPDPRTGASPAPKRTGVPTSPTRRSGGCPKPSGRARSLASARSMASAPCRYRCPRPASGASTVRRIRKRSSGPFSRRTAPRSMPGRSGDRSRVSHCVALCSGPMATAYADRPECWQDGQVVARHDRVFGRNNTVYDSPHYIPVLARHREPPPPLTITTPDARKLACEPAADCDRYDSLRRTTRGRIAGAGRQRSPMVAPMMKWMAPAPGIAMCHIGCCGKSPMRGAIHDRG